MWSVLLLILAATRICSGEDQGSQYESENAVVDAMREVSQALQCFGDTTQQGLHTIQDGLRLHRQNTDVLNSLPDMIQHVKEEIIKNYEDVCCVKREKDALDKVDILKQENLDLKNQLIDKNSKFDALDEEIRELKTLLADKDKTVITVNQENANLETQIEIKEQQVQDLNSKLGEYQRRVQELEQQVKELNNTVETQKPVEWTRECEQKQHIEKIKQVVQPFINNGDYNVLKRDLEAVMDENSEEYKQLQQSGSLGNIGYNDCTQLVSLLLCAGLPVDTKDNYGDTILHGAAVGGHLQLVKLLLDHHASVNIRGMYDWTPVIRAAAGGSLAVVRYLVQAGADTTAKGSSGDNALYVAKSRQHTEVEQYLQQLPQ